ncbi:MAG: F0F1 ATP synthase subunit B [Acidobacteria bacterium]|nr:F0F1 ATP synthase subunit B [Acidobacteriota bacterium]
MRTRRIVLGLAVAGAALALPFAGFASAAERQLSTASEECIKNVEAKDDPAACQTAPKPILPAKNEIVWGALSFIILFGVLGKFGYPAIKSMMDARTERIRNDLDGADRARSEAEGVLADYQRQLAEARTEATRIIEEARQQADQVRRDLTARAEAEAAELRQRNADQIAGERDRVLGELRTQVGVLAIELAGKVVESNLDQETNQRLIESYIDSVGSGTR